MLIYCVKKWEENKEVLRKAFEDTKDRTKLQYEDIVRMIVKNVLNSGRYAEEIKWDESEEGIHIIDDGDYQGTLLVVIHVDKYQPSEYDYLISFVDYGSCTVCDTLQRIQYENDDVNDYMKLCLDIIQNFKHPFKTYWSSVQDDLLSEIDYKTEENT